MSKKTSELLKNRKAFHEYSILERFEAGIVLTGTEIKSARNHGINFNDSFVKLIRGEAFIVNLHIAKYKMASITTHDPVRDRKLLLHKKELRKLLAKVQEKGLTIVPLSIYFKNGMLKVEIGLAKGKQLFDKREDIKKKDIDREWQRKKAYY
ncbi:MAG: SsrA-binding protein SmpB [Candidatus Muirbacterium halophilum]|nr:SsrA-binding protein SmpB [Candidatus Muirbacterium halophilum]MCK9474394.1 SsrA-binding protein SmpB [Candidatus Muirbacterium halophilum]